MKCLLCDAERSATVWQRDGTRIERCSGCGVLFTAERPPESELARLYDDEALKGTDFEAGIHGAVEFPQWKLEEQMALLDEVERMGIRRGRLLDVGCYDGFLLRNAHQRGFEVAGVEPLGKAARYVKEAFGFDVHPGTLASAGLPDAAFDVVTLLDVIEHVPDPVEELRIVFRLLRPGSVVVITTPNARGLIPWAVGTKRKMMGQAWCPIDDVPWHLWGFTPRTIRHCAEKAGFRVTAVRQLQPSPLTSNRHAGSRPWKRLVLRAAAGASLLLGSSDRMACFARKEATAA